MPIINPGQMAPWPNQHKLFIPHLKNIILVIYIRKLQCLQQKIDAHPKKTTNPYPQVNTKDFNIRLGKELHQYDDELYASEDTAAEEGNPHNYYIKASVATFISTFDFINDEFAANEGESILIIGDNKRQLVHVVTSIIEDKAYTRNTTTKSIKTILTNDTPDTHTFNKTPILIPTITKTIIEPYIYKKQSSTKNIPTTSSISHL